MDGTRDPKPPPVTVTVDNSDGSLNAVAEAAREAARRGVPLEITVAQLRSTGHADPRRTHLLQRMDSAVQVAREAAPGVEVRLPADNPADNSDVGGATPNPKGS